MPVLSLPVFVELAARASVSLAATGLVAAALRRSSASARHLVWVLGLITALVVPAASMALPKWELPIVKVATAATASGAIAHAIPAEAGSYEDRGLATAIRRNRADGVSLPSDSGANRSNFIRSISLSNALFAIWALGAAVVLGRMLLGLIAVQW